MEDFEEVTDPTSAAKLHKKGTINEVIYEITSIIVRFFMF